MLPDMSDISLKQLAQTAKTTAIAGAAAGVTMGLVRGIISVRRSRLRDPYDVAVEGLTHIGTGAILGVLGASASALAGVSVAASAGRGILTIAVPMAASMVVTSSAHERVHNIARTWSERFVIGLKPPSNADSDLLRLREGVSETE